MPRCLGYLSAAPTVSTRPEAYSAGPRAHILGVMNGFREAGWQIEPFIVGDRVASSFSHGGVQQHLQDSRILRMAADMVRLGMGTRSARQAWQTLGGRVDWVYERFATLQVLGHRFKRAGVPWILETQGLFYYETKTERATVGLPALAQHIELAAYRACDVLICVSPTLRRLLIEQCRVNPDKIVVVPNAVELDRFDLSFNGKKRFSEELTIGFVGGLIGWQALDVLMDAVAELKKQGTPIALAIIGDGVMREPWSRHAKKLGIADKVHFTGRVPATEIGQYLAQCDLGYAGPKTMAVGAMYHSPIKLYEYMAMAKPVVAAAFDDARQLIEGRDTGFLFKPDDRQSLLDTLRQVLKNRDQLAAMGQRARALIEAEHTWQARVGMMLPQLESKLAATPPSPVASQELPAFSKL
ncbi:MAG: glycosyltransferase [Cyanobacteria bacterium J06638_22]